MKAKLVAGLVAIALGGFTSCGNILEENGVINNVAQNRTGELRINLVADGSLNVTTKADGTININENKKYDNLIDQFKVTLASTTSTTVNGLPTDTTYSSIKDQTYTVPTAGNPYKLTATYTSMGEKTFAWDTPEFSGEKADINAAANSKTEASVTCYLTNSIINVTTTDLTADSKITINSLYLTIDGSEANKFVLIGEGKEDSKTLGTNTVFVKTGVSPKLTLKATLKDGTTGGHVFTNTSNLISGSGTTEGKKQYNVTYSLNDQNGQLSIGINIDGTVTTVPVNVNVDPYQ